VTDPYGRILGFLDRNDWEHDTLHRVVFTGPVSIFSCSNTGCYESRQQMIVSTGTLNHFWTHPTPELHFVVTELILHHSLVTGRGEQLFVSARLSATIPVVSPSPGQGVMEPHVGTGCRLRYRIFQFFHLPRLKYEYDLFFNV
jgi:hypothetical protein